MQDLPLFPTRSRLSRLSRLRYPRIRLPHLAASGRAHGQTAHRPWILPYPLRNILVDPSRHTFTLSPLIPHVYAAGPRLRAQAYAPVCARTSPLATPAEIPPVYPCRVPISLVRRAFPRLPQPLSHQSLPCSHFQIPILRTLPFLQVFILRSSPLLRHSPSSKFLSIRLIFRARHHPAASRLQLKLPRLRRLIQHFLEARHFCSRQLPKLSRRQSSQLQIPDLHPLHLLHQMTFGRHRVAQRIPTRPRETHLVPRILSAAHWRNPRSHRSLQRPQLLPSHTSL